MHKIVLSIAICGLMVAGCTTTEQRVAGTAAVGAGTGAIIGGLAGGGRGALVGAAVGGGTGAVVGAATAPRDCVAHDRWGHPVRDRYGRLRRVRC